MQTSSSTILEAIHKVVGVTRKQPTLHVDKTPVVFWEPDIITGYRPHGRGVTYYLKSVFQIHNETINIWTHGIGFFIILAKTMSNLPHFLAGDAKYWPLLGFGLCSLVYLLFSTVAHTLHSVSPYIHYLSYQLDYSGIAQFALGGSFLVIYVHMAEDIIPSSLCHWLLPVSVVLGWFDFLCSAIGPLKYRRPYPFRKKLLQVIPYTVHASLNVTLLMGPRYWRCFRSSSCHIFWDEPGLAYMLLCIVMGLLCAFTFSSHLPERIWPGKFDILGHGHQIFHILSIVLTWMQFDCAEQDLLHRKWVNEPEVVSLWQVLAAILLLEAMCVTTMVVIRPWAMKRAVDDELEYNKNR